MDGSDVDEGVGAFARGLEHLNLGWAFAGACLRLPGIKHLVQMLLDGSGLGPHSIPRRSCKLPLAALGPSCSVGTVSDDQSVHVADPKWRVVTNLPHEPRTVR
jgi:hypothetical protein